MSKLIIMCGAPGSGKSTYANNYKKENETVRIVSRDAIRFSLISPEDHYFSKENEVLEIFYNTIAENLNLGFDTIADASHLSKKARLTLITEIKRRVSHFDIWVVYMRPSLEICFTQNDQRTGRTNVPHGAIEKMYNSMTDPKYDGIFYEKIIYVGDNI